MNNNNCYMQNLIKFFIEILRNKLSLWYNCIKITYLFKVDKLIMFDIIINYLLYKYVLV